VLASYVPHSLRTFIERTTVLARCSLPLAQLSDPKRDPDQKIAEGVRVASDAPPALLRVRMQCGACGLYDVTMQRC
jgi:hypothetical protein